jgi:hypothetical protein
LVPIAAGEKVVASKKAATATLIKEHYGDAIAVEMVARDTATGMRPNSEWQMEIADESGRAIYRL